MLAETALVPRGRAPLDIRRPVKGWHTLAALKVLGVKQVPGQIKWENHWKPGIHRHGYLHSTRIGEGRRPKRWCAIDDAAVRQVARAAYRRLALQLHPDCGGDVEQFALAAEAYAWLTKPRGRRAP
jgi:hypothetical protein